jgi:hypothetical protein
MRYDNRMLRLTLPGGTVALIDDADQLLIAGFPWRILHAKNTDYVHAWNGNMHLYMHRLIAGAGPKYQVDHRNGNGLDNRRLNLRIANGSQNRANQGPLRMRNGRTSQYKGVSWDDSRQRWAASIHVNRKTRALGRFTDEADAARAYDRAALDTWGQFARLNFPIDNGTVCGLCDLGIIDAPCTCKEKEMSLTPDQPLRLRERKDGYWQEWYCDVPPDGSTYRVLADGDEWFDDPETGQPLRKIYAISNVTQA